MDFSILIDFFRHQTLLLNPISSSVYLFARLVYSLGKALGFSPERLMKALGKTGRKFKTEIVSSLCEHAQIGLDHLTDWLAGQLGDLDLNETLTDMLAAHVEQVGETLDQAGVEPAKQEQIAQHLETGMEQIGGAAQAVAEPFSQALLHPEERPALARAMQKNLDSYYRLSVVARRNSLIQDAKQIVEGKGAGRIEAQILAEDHSKITRATQSVRLHTRKPKVRKSRKS